MITSHQGKNDVPVAEPSFEPMSNNEQNSLNSSTRLARQGWRRGAPYNGLYWEAPLKRDTFFRPQVYERVSGISLVVVYERDTKSVISVNKGLRDAFLKKSRNCSGFVTYSYF